MGEITQCLHSDKSSMHSFDMEAVDVDENKYFLEILTITIFLERGAYNGATPYYNSPQLAMFVFIFFFGLFYNQVHILVITTQFPRDGSSIL